LEKYPIDSRELAGMSDNLLAHYAFRAEIMGNQSLAWNELEKRNAEARLDWSKIDDGDLGLILQGAACKNPDPQEPPSALCEKCWGEIKRRCSVILQSEEHDFGPMAFVLERVAQMFPEWRIEAIEIALPKYLKGWITKPFEDLASSLLDRVRGDEAAQRKIWQFFVRLRERVVCEYHIPLHSCNGSGDYFWIYARACGDLRGEVLQALLEDHGPLAAFELLADSPESETERLVGLKIIGQVLGQHSESISQEGIVKMSSWLDANADIRKMALVLLAVKLERIKQLCNVTQSDHKEVLSAAE
jgi:hypothetical protein